MSKESKDKAQLGKDIEELTHQREKATRKLEALGVTFHEGGMKKEEREKKIDRELEWELRGLELRMLKIEDIKNRVTSREEWDKSVQYAMKVNKVVMFAAIWYMIALTAIALIIYFN